MTDIMEARRKGFEEWCETQRLPTHKDGVVVTYAAKATDHAWQAWNAALDSVCVELPGYPATCDMTSTLICETIDRCAKAIERAGLKVKP